MGWLVGICGYREGGLSEVWYVRLVRLHAEPLGRRLDMLKEGGIVFEGCAAT
jgi:hypothetical protein